MAKTCPVCGASYADSSVFCATDGTTLRVENAGGDLVGSVIADRYLVSKLLGQGGMGRVYLARHVRLPQQAAIKVLHEGMVKDQEAVARFNREAANAARIEHDRVARVFDFGETSDGLVYLAMEYVPGRTLRALNEEQRRLPPARAANLVYQVAEGLDAAHRMGIVHRDLKPDNILVVTDEHGVDRSKVVDFGIAKAADNTGTQLTRTGTIIGTPEFMSPEQVVGEPLDSRSDVYALGLVAFQMFTGTLPFQGATPERALMSRLMEEPATLAAAAPDVAWPEPLQAAISLALAREATSRTASALEFADAVVAAVEAWTGTAVLRGRTPMNVPTLAPGTPPAVVALSPHGPTAGAAPLAPNAPDATAGASTAGGRGRRPVLFGGAVLALAVIAWAGFFRDSGSLPANANAPEPADTAASSSASPAGPTPAPVTRLPKSAVEKGTMAATSTASTGTPGTIPNTAGAPTTERSSPLQPAPPTAVALAARGELDRLERVLKGDSGEGEAQEVVRQLQQVLRALGSAGDSLRAYLALVTAHAMADEPLAACNPLRAAKRLAATDNQRRAVEVFFNNPQFTCVP